MAFTLPFPVRVAAGIVATGIQLVRSLPEELPAIPVALVGNAMRLSMKVQQEITTLATRGDELLGGLVGGRPQESPDWATFDEEPPRRAAKPAAGAGRPIPDAGASRPKPDTGASRPKPDAGASQPEPAPRPAAEPATEPSIRPEPEASSLPDPDTTAKAAAADVDESVVELATHARAGAPTPENDPAMPTDAEGAPAPADVDNAGDEKAPRAAEESAVTDGPAVLPGYHGMTLAQVRGHLRELSADDVTALLDYEQSGDNRAPFLTLLSNRLVTLGAQES
jgi:hypothetical protein